MIDNIKALCNAFGPSGLEDEVRDIIIEKIKNSAEDYFIDGTGNLIVFKKGKNKRDKKTVVAAHMDEVGFMVRHFHEDGYIYFETIGGISRAVASGRRLQIGDKRLSGIISAKAIHMQKASERGVCVPLEDMYIDIGCTTADEAKEQTYLGDCAVFEPNFEQFGDNMIKSKALDDRAGCAILIDIINSELEYDTYFVFTVCEEVGTRGAAVAAHRLDADEVFVVEATTAADIGGVSKANRCCALGDGVVISHMDTGTIYDKELFATAKKAALKNGIKYQIKTLVAGGNDSRSFQTGADGAKVLALSIPARYIHSATTVVKIEDIISTRDLCKTLINN